METLTFQQIGIFVAGVIIILGLLVAIKSLQRNPPLHREFVGLDQYEKDKKEIHDEFKRQAAARKGVYEKIEALSSQQEGLKTSLEHQGKLISNLDSKIDDLPERILRIVDRKGGAS